VAFAHHPRVEGAFNMGINPGMPTLLLGHSSAFGHWNIAITAKTVVA